MSRAPVYDAIGKGYAAQRIPEPSWSARIGTALGDARRILNVGAGSGNYEPEGREVVALEPSREMIRQRQNANLVARGVAEALPFRDASFDAALAIFTVHHWGDPAAGLRELRRVSQRQVLVAFEALFAHDFWLLDYIPEGKELKQEVEAPTPDFIGRHLAVREVQTLWVPHDCRDGFAACYWRRPEAYLDPAVQESISLLAVLPRELRARRLGRLRDDLESGEWARRYGHLLEQERADYGYRLILAG